MKRKIACLALFLGVLLVAEDGLADDLAQVTENGASIQVEITTHLGDSQSFVEGDTIAFLLSLDTDAYIVAIYEDADDRRIQILPNRNQESNYYQTGIFHPIPGKDAPFRFLVTEPFGTETLCVFASKAPIADLPGERLDNGLKRLHVDMASLKEQIKAQSDTGFGASCLQIRTQPGS